MKEFYHLVPGLLDGTCSAIEEKIG